MKKFLSTILAVVMVLSSMAMVVSANNADYAEGYYYVNGVQYTDFMAAVSAANGGTVIVSGECAFGSRLAVNSSVTLQGVNDATIVPSASYGSTDSTTNWKGLLNIAGENVIVNDITFDGSIYGDTVSMSTDFVPVRCTSGTITLDNVTIKGSKRSLLLIGSSTTTADVTVGENGLYCEGYTGKTIIEGNSYPDVNVIDGNFTMAYGVVNGFIAEDHETEQGEMNVTAAGHYTFEYTSGVNVCTTPKHIADTYLASNVNWLEAQSYMRYLKSNDDKVVEMLQYVYTNRATMTEEVADWSSMLADMISKDTFKSYKSYLEKYQTILNGTYNA